MDSDGLVRVVLCARDPGVANWLDTAGHSNGADHPALRAHHNRAHAVRRGWWRSTTSMRNCPRTPKRSPPKNGHPSSRHAAAPCAKGSDDDVRCRRAGRRRLRRNGSRGLRLALLSRGTRAHRRGAEHRGGPQRDGPGHPARDHQQRPDPAPQDRGHLPRSTPRSTTRWSAVRSS